MEIVFWTTREPYETNQHYDHVLRYGDITVKINRFDVYPEKPWEIADVLIQRNGWDTISYERGYRVPRNWSNDKLARHLIEITEEEIGEKLID